MRISVRREDFSSGQYELCISKSTLDFNGKDDPFSLPYQEISDFCVTRGKQGKTYFTMLYGGRILEGQILDVAEVEQFTAALQKKLSGTINIEVKRN